MRVIGSPCCVVCARPFYELECWYAPFAAQRVKSAPGSWHFPHMYFDHGKGAQKAPLPFHHPDLWKEYKPHEITGFKKVGGARKKGASTKSCRKR